jgi:hypothetical protein
VSKARPIIAAKYTLLDLDADIILMNGPAAAVRRREFLSSEMLPAAGSYGFRVERGVGIAGGHGRPHAPSLHGHLHAPSRLIVQEMGICSCGGCRGLSKR